MKGKFDALVIGSKPDGDEEKEERSDDSEKEESFGVSAAGVAIRAFARAIGASPSDVDVPKATKALKAAIAACKSEDEDEEDEY